MPRVRHVIRRVRPRSDRAGPEQETVTRRLLNLLTALSLLLCVAVVALWVRSYYRADEILVARAGGTLWRASAGRGLVQVLASGPWPLDEPLRWRSSAPFAPGS